MILLWGAGDASPSTGCADCGVAAEPPPAVALQNLAQWLWGGNFSQLGGLEMSKGLCPRLGLMSLLPLQGYHRSNHFIATQGESRPALSAPDVAQPGFVPGGIKPCRSRKGKEGSNVEQLPPLLPPLGTAQPWKGALRCSGAVCASEAGEGTWWQGATARAVFCLWPLSICGGFSRVSRAQAGDGV